MIETKEKCWKKTSETKKGLNKNKKWRFFLGWVFFGGFSWREKRILKVISNTVENKTDFFAQKMFLNQENRNRKQKRVFPTFHHKKHILIFAYIRKEKKEKQSWKDEAKKKASYKNEKPFFKTQKKTKHGKINQCKKTQQKRKQRKRSFFEVKRKRVSQKLKIFSHKECDKKNIEMIKRQKRKFKKGEKVKETRKQGETKKREQMERGWTKGGNKEVKKTF